MDNTASNGQKIAISSIMLVEMVYLIEKGRLAPSAYNVMSDAIENPDHLYTEVSLTSAIVEYIRRLPRDQVPDMPDRIIAATALYLGVTSHQPRPSNPPRPPRNRLVTMLTTEVMSQKSPI
jgi:PIN domain nuclease of toxin-antitoxin system